MAILDCTDPDVLKSAYGGSVCKVAGTATYDTTVDEQRRAEMDAAGWTGGGWNVYQEAVARRDVRKGVPSSSTVAPPVAFPWVPLGLGAVALGAGVYLWRSR